MYRCIYCNSIFKNKEYGLRTRKYDFVGSQYNVITRDPNCIFCTKIIPYNKYNFASKKPIIINSLKYSPFYWSYNDKSSFIKQLSFIRTLNSTDVIDYLEWSKLNEIKYFEIGPRQYAPIKMKNALYAMFINKFPIMAPPDVENAIWFLDVYNNVFNSYKHPFEIQWEKFSGEDIYGNKLTEGENNIEDNHDIIDILED